jgi:transposase
MDLREQRGREIAARCLIVKRDGFWRVPSDSGNGRYTVAFDRNPPTCSCEDHQERGVKCKHIHAVEFTIQRQESGDDGSDTVTDTIKFTDTARRTYRQDWPAYNAAQVSEKSLFQSLLSDLCAGLRQPQPVRCGRPRVPIDDAIFAAVFKVYSTVSGRRFMSDLEDARDKGHIGFTPCYNSIFKVFESEATTPILKQLVAVTAAPLKAVETSFACDSSGFSGSRFDRWFDYKWGGQRSQRAWVKAHIMCGVKTNVITAVEIHGCNAGDAPQLPALLSATAHQFNVAEVSADLGYTADYNFQAIADAGAVPFIPFKSNAKERDGVWAKMFHFFHFNKDAFLARYHLRSNVESTFAMIKAKFGDSVRSKTDVAMRNEVLAKIVAHNICCLISAIHELGLDVNLRPASSPALTVVR